MPIPRLDGATADDLAFMAEKAFEHHLVEAVTFLRSLLCGVPSDMAIAELLRSRAAAALEHQDSGDLGGPNIAGYYMVGLLLCQFAAAAERVSGAGAGDALPN